jgi:methylenetetrahydrofolate reductase (NADPH)
VTELVIPFEIVCELDPPTRPDLRSLHDQLDALSSVTSTFLIPDNHTGRATVSSIAVASEVARRGATAIACVNARDRNLLGFRRDLLTCALYGIDDLLLVYGDEPSVGERAGGLTVAAMLEECRAVDASGDRDGPLNVGVTTRLGKLSSWKHSADRLFVQVSWSIDELLAWRETVDVDIPLYPAVMVLPSAAMARRLAVRIPELAMPDEWIDAIERDPTAGLHRACELVDAIRLSDAFAGVHLICGSRYGAVADLLGAKASPVTS